MSDETQRDPAARPGEPAPWWARPEGDAWSGPPAGGFASSPTVPNPALPVSGQPSPGQRAADQPPYPGAQPYPGQPSFSGGSPYGAPPAYGSSPGETYPGASYPGDVIAGGPGQRDPLGRPDGRRRGPASWLLVSLALAIALIAGALGGALGFLAANQSETSSRTGTFDGSSLGAAPEGSLDRAPDSVAGVAARVLPSVVSIAVSGGGQQGTGSGFVLSADGLLITNNHVVEAAADGGDIEVAFADGERLPATIVGRDASYDLAVLRVDAQNLPPLPLGSSQNVQVGDPVIAIGSPLGLAGTVTLGIVSAKDRPVTAGQGGTDASYISAIQTDAAINPGNSGGPLVNLAGEVVGVNSAIATLGAGGPASGQGGSIGLGFAIPIDQARRTAEQLIQGGVAVRPVIGALLDNSYTGEGAKIADEPGVDGTPPLTPGGPAEQAGIRPGEVIVALDGKPVQGNEELIVAIRTHVPGDTVTLTVLRDGKEQDIPVVLGEAQQ